MYHVFKRMGEDSQLALITKGLVVAKQQKFSKTNLKAIKVSLEQSLKKAPLVDLDTMNKRKQKRLAKSIIDEDQGLNRFDISRKIQKIMVEQPKKNLKRMKKKWSFLHGSRGKKHVTISSSPMHPSPMSSVPQRLKDQSETNENDEGLVQVPCKRGKQLL